MFSCRLVITQWNGQGIQEKIRTANKRLAGSIAYDAQSAAKTMAHVATGRMQGATTVVSPSSGFAVDRNASPADYGKDREGAIAVVEMTGDVAAVLMGSFVPYAFIEEVLRGHRFVQPGLDIARSNIAMRVAQVGAEVGLK